MIPAMVAGRLGWLAAMVTRAPVRVNSGKGQTMTDLAAEPLAARTEVEFAAGASAGTADSVLYLTVKQTREDGTTRYSTGVLVGCELDALRDWLSRPRNPEEVITFTY
jgi:hypothetical protein